ncbi:uncharacterized protein [Atheta coriaria]|uniref:uncharacterized protein n=1 Tax=Dalotia coriaria TaxID=877792 RepID=UPI0031F3BDAE
MAVTLEDCKKIIQRYTKDDSTAVAFQVVTLSDTPAGYLGEHYRLCITYKTSQNRLQIANFFLKCVPTGNQNFTDYVLELGVFRKEANLYKHLLNDFQKHHTAQIAPKSYLVNPESFIVLEDLSKKGFSMVDQLSHENIVQLMKTLARFHSSSIIFEERRSFPGKPYKLIDHFPDELKETTFSPVEGSARYKWGISTSKAVANTILMQSQSYTQIAEDFLKFAQTDIFEYVFPSKKFRNVICHADLWKNNALFKNTSNGTDECVLIDYQLVRYTPPALDVMTALHVNCSTSYLKDNMKELLNTYYNTFKDCLQKHGVSIDVVFKGNEFQESIDHYEIASLTESAMFGTIIFIGKELGQQLTSDENAFNEFNYTNRSKYIMNEIANNPAFESRYTDILNRLIGYLLKRNVSKI